MRRIFIEDGLSVRFPGRDEEFDQGFEIGLLAAMMSSGQSSGALCIAADAVAQAQALAEKMGFRLTSAPAEDGVAEVTFTSARARPRLQLIHSRAQPETADIAEQRTGAEQPRPVLVSA